VPNPRPRNAALDRIRAQAAANGLLFVALLETLVQRSVIARDDITTLKNRAESLASVALLTSSQSDAQVAGQRIIDAIGEMLPSQPQPE